MSNKNFSLIRRLRPSAKLRAVLLALSMAALLSGCTPQMESVDAPAATPLATVEPTATPEPTPTATPVPTPTATPTPEPTKEVTPKPAATAAPAQSSGARKLDPNGKMVALTFDDGPHSTITRRIANCLEQYNGRGTFFVVGDRVSGNSKTLARVASAGHQIGSHTWSHKNLKSLSAEGVASEVRRAQTAIRNVTGSAPRIIRPPYGSTGETARAAIRDTANLAIVNWSVDSEDWKSKNADTIVREVMKNVKDGDIVLMHDLYASTAEAVERLVPKLTQAGYQLVTVDELYRLRGDSLSAGKLHFKNPL